MTDSNIRHINSAPSGTPGGDDGGGVGDRLAKIEAKMEFMATSKDISDLKTLIAENQVSSLHWGLGIVVLAGGVLITIMKTF